MTNTVTRSGKTDSTSTALQGHIGPAVRPTRIDPDAADFSWMSLPCTMQLAPARERDMPPRLADVRVGYTGDALHVHFRCPIIDAMLSRPTLPASGFSDCEHVRLQLFPGSGPSTAYQFKGEFRGIKEAAIVETAFPEPEHGGPSKTFTRTKPVLGDWHRYHEQHTDHWNIEFVIPWETLGLNCIPSNIGFSCFHTYRIAVDTPSMFDLSLWPADLKSSDFGTGMEFGKLLLNESAGSIANVTLDSLRFGSNAAAITFSDDWTTPPTAIRTTTLDANGESVATQSSAVDSNTSTQSAAFELQRDASTHVDMYRPQVVQFDVLEDETSAPLYTFALPFGRHIGLPVDEAFGESLEPASENLRERWISRIAAQLPRLHRRNTNEGAPSDFCLCFEDGSVAVNLMADDAWQQMTALIESRFTTAADRIIAAMLLIGQKSVTAFSNVGLFHNSSWQHTYHTPMHKMFGPLSIIRYGGGTPSARAVVLAALLSHVTNPNTGDTFTTRPVFLNEDGGPDQPPVHYDAAKGNYAYFGQHPTAISVVAVGDGAEMTLVDPTALSFFPADESELAGIEEIKSNAELQRLGAGPSANAFAGIHADEIYRQSPNQLLTRGVFPELCRDEDGGDRPFDPSIRQSPIVLIDATHASSLHHFTLVDEDGNETQKTVELSIERTSNALKIKAIIEGIETSQWNDADRAFESINLAIDAKHSHSQFQYFAGGINGATRSSASETSIIQTLAKHIATTAWRKLHDIPLDDWSYNCNVTENGYEATFEIPWSSLGLNGEELPPVIGMNLWVNSRYPQYEQAFVSAPRWHLAADAFSFADVYLKGADVVVKAVDYGIPQWGDNIADVTIANLSERSLNVALQSIQACGMVRSRVVCVPTTVALSPGQEQTVRVDFFLSPKEKMTSGSPQIVTWTMHADDQLTWQAETNSTYCGELYAYQRFGDDVPEVELPSPDHPEYAERKVQAIARALPRFVRKTTRDGAVSDFVIETEDGSVSFNLMNAGAMDEIGEWMYEQFDNDFDRILGMFQFNYSPNVLRHMSSGHRFVDGCGPLSIMRANHAGAGGNCGYHSRAFSGLLAHMKLDAGPLRANTCGIFGHAVSMFEHRDSYVIIDGDVGHVTLTDDGKDFATMDDLRKNADLPSTASSGELARYLSTHEASQLARGPMPEHAFANVFPANAPKI